MLSVNRISAAPHFTAQETAQTQSNPIETKSIEPVQNDSTQEESQNTDKSLSTGAKAGIGVGFAALAGIGIYIATRGKSGKKSVEQGAQHIQETAHKAGNTLKELTIDEFKKAGKFIKGKAVTASGENFTGVLTKKMQNGNTLSREYENGLLKQVSQKNGDKLISSKTYHYDENGMLTEVKNPKGQLYFKKAIEGDVIHIKTPKREIKKDIKTGKLLQEAGIGIGAKTYHYDNNGKLNYMIHQDSSKGVIGAETRYSYYPDGKTVRIIDDTSDGVKFFDKDGKLIDSLRYCKNEYDFCYKDMSVISDYHPVSGKRRKYDTFGWGGETMVEKSHAISKNGRKSETLVGWGKDFDCVKFENIKGKNSVKYVQYKHNALKREDNPKLYDELVAKAKDVISERAVELKKALRLRNEVLKDRKTTDNIQRYFRPLFSDWSDRAFVQA